MFEKAAFYAKFILAAFPLLFERLGIVIRGQLQHFTYKPGDNPRNIIIIGASFGGQFLATELAKQIPSGYRVILIDKNSHFNFTWLFPRISVVEGHEHKAFVPYHGAFRKLAKGSLEFIQASVVAVDDKHVTLQNGTRLEYAYLAVATGATGVPPWHLVTGEKRDGIETFRTMQKAIAESKDFVVVGGGAVGVELAGDAKSKYPEKNVTLIHSRDKLLNTFGPKLHEYVIEEFKKMKLNVHLEERVPAGVENEAAGTITLKSGEIISYDYLVKCTGARPNSDLLKNVSPSSISPSGSITVQKTLQITDPKYPNIYAFGDVAETGNVRMGRTAGMQATTVAANIVRAIKGKPLKENKPFKFLQCTIDLTVGLGHSVIYMKYDEQEFLIPRKKKIDLDAPQIWKMNGARPFEDPDYKLKSDV